MENKKELLLKLLVENECSYINGPTLTTQCNYKKGSQMRKDIASLRSEGKLIEACQKKGYRYYNEPTFIQAKQIYKYLEQRTQEIKSEAIRINAMKKTLFKNYKKEALNEKSDII